MRHVRRRSGVGMSDIGVGGGEARTGLGVCVRDLSGIAVAVVFARRLRGLDAVARFYHVGFERYGARSAVEFEEEAAGIAEDGAGFVASPERSSGGGAVLADGLWTGCC